MWLWVCVRGPFLSYGSEYTCKVGVVGLTWQFQGSGLGCCFMCQLHIGLGVESSRVLLVGLAIYRLRSGDAFIGDTVHICFVPSLPSTEPIRVQTGTPTQPWSSSVYGF